MPIDGAAIFCDPEQKSDRILSICATTQNNDGFMTSEYDFLITLLALTSTAADNQTVLKLSIRVAVTTGSRAAWRGGGGKGGWHDEIFQTPQSEPTEAWPQHTNTNREET